MSFSVEFNLGDDPEKVLERFDAEKKNHLDSIREGLSQALIHGEAYWVSLSHQPVELLFMWDADLQAFHDTLPIQESLLTLLNEVVSVRGLDELW